MSQKKERVIVYIDGFNLYFGLLEAGFVNCKWLDLNKLAHNLLQPNQEIIEIKNNKGAQAIRIPKKMRINDDKVYLKKVGNTLYVIPYHSPWHNLIESTDSFTSDFMVERNQPIQQQRDSFD